MLSEILTASLLHLRIHCGGTESDNNDSTKHQRGDRDEAVAHLTGACELGTQKVGVL